MAFKSDSSSFCNLIQKLKFENEASSVSAAQQRHCRALRSLAVLNFQKALDLNDASLSTAILEHGLQKYSKAVDAKPNGTNSILVRETVKDVDSKLKVDRSAWKCGLAGLKLQPACENKESEEEIRSWHSKVMQRTKRIEQRTQTCLEATRAPKRKMPPSQDVSETDSPPPPPSVNKFNSVFSPREWKSKKPQELQSSIKQFLQPPAPKQNQWTRQNTFEQHNPEEPKFGNWQNKSGPPIRNNQNAPPNKEQAAQQPSTSAFKSARVELAAQNVKKYGHSGGVLDDPPKKRSLGGRRGPPPPSTSNKYVPHKAAFGDGSKSDDELDEEFDERLKNIAPEMIKMIRNEIMDIGKPVSWDDIAGLESVKATIQEIVVWPLLRPDIFAGLRGPPKGILLFGPPGTGKTLIGKCIASQSKSTFFSISASSLTSKWVGDGEKMVRALFAVARCHQPAVIFIDEIDSLLSQRSETEHESSRRIKTEFLVQLDGAATCEEERILVVGATNRPQELDEAARRRLVKRLYVALPEAAARAEMIARLMAAQQCSLSEQQMQQVARLAQGFSGADMRHLCREAAYGPIRAISHSQIQHIQPQQVRPVALEDFTAALQHVRPSVSTKDLGLYQEWNNTYGYGSNST